MIPPLTTKETLVFRCFYDIFPAVGYKTPGERGQRNTFFALFQYLYEFIFTQKYFLVKELGLIYVLQQKKRQDMLGLYG